MVAQPRFVLSSVLSRVLSENLSRREANTVDGASGRANPHDVAPRPGRQRINVNADISRSAQARRNRRPRGPHRSRQHGCGWSARPERPGQAEVQVVEVVMTPRMSCLLPGETARRRGADRGRVRKSEEGQSRDRALLPIVDSDPRGSRPSCWSRSCRPRSRFRRSPLFRAALSR